MQSIRYNVLTQISKVKLKSYFSDFPILLRYFQNYVFNYNDPAKQALRQVFRSIGMFAHLNELHFHNMIYSCREVTVEKDRYLIAEDDIIE